MNRKIELVKVLRWVLFLGVIGGVLLFLAFGAANAYLSKPGLAQKMAAQISSTLPNWNVEVGRIELELSGFPPRLTILVKDIEAQETVGRKSKEEVSFCEKVRLRADVSSFRLSWRYLLRGLLHIRPVEVQEIVGSLLQEKCETPEVKLSQKKAKPFSVKKEIEKTQKQKALEIKKNREALFSSLLVHRVLLQKNNLEVELTNLRSGAFFPDEKLVLRGLIHPRVSNLEKEALPRLSAEVSYYENNLGFQLQGVWREGQVQLMGQVSLEESVSGKANVQLKHVSLKSIAQLLKEIDLMDQEIKEPSPWINCQGEIFFQSRKVQSENVNCSLEGKLGQGVFENLFFEYEIESQLFNHKNVRVQLDQIDLEKALSELDIEVLGGVIHDYGLLSGSFFLGENKDWQLKGEIQDAFISFSNRGVRGRQKVLKLQGSVEQKNKEVLGKVQNMELENGEFSGEVIFLLDSSLKEGTSQINLEKLTLDPSVQRLLAGEKLEGLGIKGLLTVKDGAAVTWKGLLKAEEIETGEGLELKGVQSISKYEKQEFQFLISSKEGSVSQSSGFYELFKKKQAKKKIGEEISWENFKAQVTLRKDQSGTVKVLSPKKNSAVWTFKNNVWPPDLEKSE